MIYYLITSCIFINILYKNLHKNNLELFWKNKIVRISRKLKTKNVPRHSIPRYIKISIYMNIINIYQSIIILEKWNYRNNNFPTIYTLLHVWKYFFLKKFTNFDIFAKRNFPFNWNHEMNSNLRREKSRISHYDWCPWER